MQKLVILGQEIETVESTKSLGDYLDSRLGWRNPIDYIKGKILRGIWIICKARKYLNQSTLKSLYHAFIYPYLNHFVEVWGNTYKSDTDPLVRLQKRVLRIITGSAKFPHTAVLFSELQTEIGENFLLCCADIHVQIL